MLTENIKNCIQNVAGNVMSLNHIEDIILNAKKDNTESAILAQLKTISKIV